MRIHDFLDWWAVRQPEAICATDGTRSVTWAGMRSWSNQVGGWLAGELEPEARFGVLAKNSLEYLAIYFGASRAAVVPVPLNYRLTAPELSFIISDADVQLLIAEEEFGETLDKIPGSVRPNGALIGRVGPRWRDFSAEVAAQPDEAPSRNATTDMPLYQMYTSGTTGTPKGAVLTQGAVTSNIVQIQTLLGLFQSRALVVMPLFHAAAAVSAFTYVAGGSTMHLVRDFDPPGIATLIRDEAIATVTLAPTMIQTLLGLHETALAPYPDLQVICYGASAISSEVLRKAISRFGCDFMQCYGMTELSGAATALTPEDHRRALECSPELLLSAGRAILGTQLRIVDDNDHDVAPGEPGEVVVRGPQVMSGYWNQHEATARALRNGWMHTGDLGKRDAEGYLFIVDRIKDMIVSGGENIYPREVEEALFTLTGVVDAAVIGIPDDRWGEAVKAFIVTDNQTQLSEQDVLTHCRGLLAGYKCPTSIEFIELLPRNVTGKVLKTELRAPYWANSSRAIN